MTPPTSVTQDAVVLDLPAWSGEFWEGEDYGYIALHVGDLRTVTPPPGWVLVQSWVEGDEEVFEYRRVSKTLCVCRLFGGRR